MNIKRDRTKSDAMSLKTPTFPTTTASSFYRNYSQTSKNIPQLKNKEAASRASPLKFYGPYNDTVPILEHMKFDEDRTHKVQGISHNPNIRETIEFL